jgi:hypothetical protein
MTYDKNANYCSFSPESLFGIKFNYSCYLHDRQYRNEVKFRKTRKQTDIHLRDVILKTFQKNTKPLSFGLYFPEKIQKVKFLWIGKICKFLMKFKFKITNHKLIKIISPKLGYSVSRIYYLGVRWFSWVAWE